MRAGGAGGAQRLAASPSARSSEAHLHAPTMRIRITATGMVPLTATVIRRTTATGMVRRTPIRRTTAMETGLISATTARVTKRTAAGPRSGGTGGGPLRQFPVRLLRPAVPPPSAACRAIRSETRMQGLVASAFFSVMLLAGALMLGLPSQLAGPASAGEGDQVPPVEGTQSPSAAPSNGTASVARICDALAAAAGENDLPVAFFARLIWEESRFDPTAVSRAGAQGVAQFMPATANARGLADPFDPMEAIAHSAKLLRDLRREFGNLGLAAAAYNAGP